jgi:uncharacterized protein
MRIGSAVAAPTRSRPGNQPAVARGPALPVLPYFVLTFAWTWSWWWAAAATGRPVTQLPVPLLFMLGGLGPLVGAVWMVRRGDRAYRREFLRRVWDPRGIPAPWWIALVAVAAAPALLGAAVAGATRTAVIVPDYSLAAVAGVIAFALAAGLAEEPGWRGAASDAWQARTRPVWAAAGIGVLWAVWHLPLYFVEGSYQHGLGFASVRFWLTNLVLVELGVLYVWLANGGGSSILLAVLAHAGFNAAGELVPRSTTGDVVAFLVVTTATVAVIAVTRGRLHAQPTRPALLHDRRGKGSRG